MLLEHPLVLGRVDDSAAGRGWLPEDRDLLARGEPGGGATMPAAARSRRRCGRSVRWGDGEAGGGGLEQRLGANLLFYIVYNWIVHKNHVKSV